MNRMKKIPSDEHIAKEIRRIKIIGRSILGACFLIGILLMVVKGIDQYNHTFTTEKWIENPEQRTQMVTDMLGHHQLIGMTELELRVLLGENDNDYGYFNDEGNWVYYLGAQWLGPDSEWLVINVKEGIVTDYELTTD